MRPRRTKNPGRSAGCRHGAYVSNDLIALDFRDGPPDPRDATRLLFSYRFRRSRSRSGSVNLYLAFRLFLSDTDQLPFRFVFRGHSDGLAMLPPASVNLHRCVRRSFFEQVGPNLDMRTGKDPRSQKNRQVESGKATRLDKSRSKSTSRYDHRIISSTRVPRRARRWFQFQGGVQETAKRKHAQMEGRVAWHCLLSR